MGLWLLGSPCIAYRPDDASRATRELSPLANATMMYNAANSPVGVVPVTRVDPAKDALTSGKWPVSKTGGSWLVAQACARAYDPVAMTGVPVGVQVRKSALRLVCTRLREWRTDHRAKMGGRESAGGHGCGGQSTRRAGIWAVCWRRCKSQYLDLRQRLSRLSLRKNKIERRRIIVWATQRRNRQTRIRSVRLSTRT
jgi:hypothetical protein